MTLRQTHTYAELEVSAETYAEVATKLLAAGYDHVFELTGPTGGNGIEHRGAIDMHGLALVTERSDTDAIALDAANEIMKAMADSRHCTQQKAAVQLIVTKLLKGRK